MNQLAIIAATNAPALIAASGARLLSLPRILHRADQEPEHAPRLCARRGGILRLAFSERRHPAYGDRERACRDLCRGAAARAIRADRKAAPGRTASPVWLDGDRPDHADQSSRRRARAAPFVRRGKTPVLDPTEVRRLLDAIDTTTIIGLRDRALIGLMVYSFVRIGATIGMQVEDVYTQNRRLWVRLHEKGGKQHAMSCHHNLETYLHAYLDGAGLSSDPKALLFQSFNRATGQLNGSPLPQANAYAMIQRRTRAAGSRRRSAITPFVRPASPPTSRTAGHSRRPRRWRIILRRGRHSSMIGEQKK